MLLNAEKFYRIVVKCQQSNVCLILIFDSV